MDRAKTVFAVIAVLAIGAAVGLGVAAKNAFDEAKDAKDRAVSDVMKLDKIYKEEVFPSKENVQAMKEVVAAFESERDDMTNSLSKLNVPMVSDTSPSAFVQSLATAIKALAESAPIVDGVKSVSPNFAFGFDAYVGSNPAMPLENEVPALSRQLVLVYRLVSSMYASQVSKIDSIKRDAQDQATLHMATSEAASKEGRGRRGRRGRGDAETDEEDSAPRKNVKNVKKPKAGAKGVVAPEAPLFTSQTMTVEFKARQNALIGLLNRIASMKAFVVVTDMAISKVGSDVRLPGGAEASAAGESQQKGRGRRGQARSEEEPAAVAVEDQISTLPAEMRVMTGPDVDPVLAVRLNLEIYDFSKEGK